MTIDVKDQVRRYADHVVAMVPVCNPRDIVTTEVGAEVGRPLPRLRRPVAVVLAAFVAILLAVGGVALLLTANQPDVADDVRVPSVTTAAAATSTSVPATDAVLPPGELELSNAGVGSPLREGTVYVSHEGASPEIRFTVDSAGWRGATGTCYDLVQAVVLDTPSGGGIRIVPMFTRDEQPGFPVRDASTVAEEIVASPSFTAVTIRPTSVAGYEAERIEATVSDGEYLATFEWGRGYWMPGPAPGSKVVMWVVETGVPDVLILATQDAPSGLGAPDGTPIESVIVEAGDLLSTLTITPGEISECRIEAAG